MNPFEAELKQAHRRQLRFFAALGGALVVVIMVVFGVLVMTSGVSVKIQPDEAQIAGEISVVSGWAIAVNRTVYTIVGIPTIKVSSPGYQSVERSISSQERGGVLTVLLLPLPGVLDVRVGHGLDDTNWLIDGQIAATGSAVKIERAAGHYSLEVSHPFFEPYASEIEFQRGKTETLEINQEPVQGQIVINSQPIGALVEINHETVGKTPFSKALQGGAYDVKVTLPGFKGASETIAIRHDAKLAEREYLLQRLPADLTVEALPEGGRLLINGQARSLGERVTLPSATPISISYFKSGFSTAQQRLELQPGEDRLLQINLVPQKVEVRFTSNPFAEVYLDGRKIGTTPIKKTLLSQPHRVEFRKKGYRTVQKTFTPSPEADALISAILVRELEARLKEQGPEYTNKAGLVMRRFRPDQVTMGAPRSEKGQRANEFQRTVSLTKIFYASETEVSNRSYRQFKPGYGSGADDAVPAVGMSWEEAAQFCNWLSAQESLTPFYRFDQGRYLDFDANADGYRLLSEAEWEWLARKAGKPKQTKYSWGDDDIIPPGSGNIADENANGLMQYFVKDYQDGFAGLAPIGSFKAEPSGLKDLFGNVSEWVHDVYDLVPPDQGRIERDRLGPSGGANHVVKGANYRSGQIGELRPSYRQGLHKGQPDVGFRIARYLLGGTP